MLPADRRRAAAPGEGYPNPLPSRSLVDSALTILAIWVLTVTEGWHCIKCYLGCCKSPARQHVASNRPVSSFQFFAALAIFVVPILVVTLLVFATLSIRAITQRTGISETLMGFMTGFGITAKLWIGILIAAVTVLAVTSYRSCKFLAVFAFGLFVRDPKAGLFAEALAAFGHAVLALGQGHLMWAEVHLGCGIISLSRGLNALLKGWLGRGSAGETAAH